MNKYYNATDARWAVLTNGLVYQFYTGTEDNMNQSVFLEVNLEKIDKYEFTKKYTKKTRNDK